MSLEDKILAALVYEFKRRVLEEGLSRIQKCLDLLTEGEVWNRPNQNTVSVGNLVLHLSGNVRQWIGSGIGNIPDERKRDLEFNTTAGVSKIVLYTEVEKTVLQALDILNKISIEDLLETKEVQVYKESGLSIIIHVIEHFSYHVGQITYATKSMKNVDTKYYPEDLG